MQNNSMIQNITDLKCTAIKVTENSSFFYPLGERPESSLKPQVFNPGYLMKYSKKNHVISFVDENGNWYIIPALNGIEDILKNNRYKKASFYVPCAEDGSYPIKEKEEWETLIAAMHA